MHSPMRAQPGLSKVRMATREGKPGNHAGHSSHSRRHDALVRLTPTGILLLNLRGPAASRAIELTTKFDAQRWHTQFVRLLAWCISTFTDLIDLAVASSVGVEDGSS